MSDWRFNFPEELSYENIAKKMGGTLITSSDLDFQFGSLKHVDAVGKMADIPVNDEELRNYVFKLPKRFDEWIRKWDYAKL